MVTGVLRGFDPYMNIVMDDTVEERSSSQKLNIGMVVSFLFMHSIFELRTYYVYIVNIVMKSSCTGLVLCVLIVTVSTVYLGITITFMTKVMQLQETH